MSESFQLRQSGKTFFTINSDGTVTIPAGVTLDEATAAFWIAAVAKGPAARIATLEAGMREIYEVWAGSDGFIPETAPEGYQQQIIKQMVDIAAKHMKTTRWRPGACQATGIMERINQSGDRK